ncbi:hypothetical protein MMC11_001505 [Xylographa trunciseda]|nr:hypothetical protein [Xylographa trunciseda]
MYISWRASLGFILGGLGLVAAAADPNFKSIPLRTHSLTPPYLDTDMQSRWFEFGGDTIVRADKYIRLASDLQSRIGWIFSKVPLTATNWEIEFEFKIHGKGNLHGDGMALWITKQRATGGPIFGSVDKFEGLGIFFDTYKNNRPGVTFPYVMAMVGDGQTSYDKNNDGKDQELAGCSARGIRGAAIPTKARLTYFQDQSLKLELRYKSEDEWTLCFETSSVPIPSVAYLGFSAETGELSDNFDIISVETKNIYSTVASSDPMVHASSSGKDKGRPKARRAGGGWGWFFVKIMLVGVAIGGGYVGWTMYKGSKRHSRFD